MITFWANKIVDILTKHSKDITDQDQREVYVYGLECIINTGFSLFILFLWSLISHSLYETLTWIVSFCLLRHHSGGIHAPTQFTCILSSTLLGISNYFVINRFHPNENQFFYAFTLCLIICIICSPTRTNKIKLSHQMYVQKKITSILIIILGYLATYILPITIGVSITYAFLCVVFLILPKHFVRH